mmetsp:Transcript_62362/g.174235  ORF Transcript_62362/g.174235 Transcript_62362/m.174235 type:complete len:253 (+) Transcript_62362:1303-2061(+)
MMESSTDLMPTGSSMMPKTQAPSHGAGQTRPVNSGKLFVFISRRNASSQFPLLIRIFHSGMRLPNGQPDLCVTLWWQNGVPQSMQRAACVRICTSSFTARISWKSPVRSTLSRLGSSARSRIMKPRLLFTTCSTSSTFLGRLPLRNIGAMSSMSMPEVDVVRSGNRMRLGRVAAGWSCFFPGLGIMSNTLTSGEGLPASFARSMAFMKSMGKRRVNSAALAGQRFRMLSATALPVKSTCDFNIVCKSCNSWG